MGKVHHLVTQVASGSPLHSAPLQRSRAPPTTAHRRQALTPVWWTCCGHGRCTHAAWCRPQLRCRPAWSWRPTSGVVSGRRLNESVEQRVTSVPLESLLGRNPGAGPRNTPRSRLSRIAGHSRAARSELAATHIYQKRPPSRAEGKNITDPVSMSSRSLSASHRESGLPRGGLEVRQQQQLRGNYRGHHQAAPW